MNLEQELYARCGSKCELCGAEDALVVYEVPPDSNGRTDQSVLICVGCREQIEGTEEMDAIHWRCLKDSMWIQVPPVQVMAWRILTRLNSEAWAQDLLDMFYLDEDTLSWAQAAGDGSQDVSSVKHIDSNGAVLEAGDSVILIKDLNVKGANFTAKRGTAVRGISLVADNAEHIEGRVNGQQIVILTKFVKKTN